MIVLNECNYWAIEAARYVERRIERGFAPPGVFRELKHLNLTFPLGESDISRLEEYSIQTTRDVIKRIDSYRTRFLAVSKIFKDIVNEGYKSTPRGICFHLLYSFTFGLPSHICHALSCSYMISIRNDVAEIVDPRVKNDGVYWFPLTDPESRVQLCQKLADKVCPFCGTLTNCFPYCPTL